MGDSTCTESLHKFLLERIAKQFKPIFLGSELACYPEADVSIWLNADVLKRVDAPITFAQGL